MLAVILGGTTRRKPDIRLLRKLVIQDGDRAELALVRAAVSCPETVNATAH